jgi:hypothetical protein
VPEDPRSRRADAHDVEGQRVESLDERRRLDDRVALESEARNREQPAGKANEIVELGARGRHPIAIRRPPELAQQARGIEHVPRGQRRPFPVHETDQVNGLEIAVSRRPGVHEVQPFRPQPRREHLVLDPAAKGGRDVVHRDDRIRKAAVRVAQHGEAGRDGGPGPLVPVAKRIVHRGRTIVPLEELEQDRHLR